MMSIGLAHYLMLAMLMFMIGFFIAVSKRNAIAVLMGIELMLNATNINMVCFNRYLHPDVAMGTAFMMFVLVVAAAEVAVGLAIIMKNYRERGTADVAEINWLKW